MELNESQARLLMDQFFFSGDTAQREIVWQLLRHGTVVVPSSEFSYLQKKGQAWTFIRDSTIPAPSAIRVKTLTLDLEEFLASNLVRDSLSRCLKDTEGTRMRLQEKASDLETLLEMSKIKTDETVGVVL
jgi:hypothetical protein